MKIPGIMPARSFGGWLVAVVLLLAGRPLAFSRPVPGLFPPVPMKLAPSDTNLPAWHSVKVAPSARGPKIHFYDKLNPVWWVENVNEPVPPAWYLPGNQHRNLKWHFRNPFHNFDFYVAGVADKPFVRSGHYPERNSNPRGGWDFEVVRRRLALLPFVSFERPKITFYFGWRESGAFGAELRWHHQAKKGKGTSRNPATDASG